MWPTAKAVLKFIALNVGEDEILQINNLSSSMEKPEKEQNKPKTSRIKEIINNRYQWVENSKLWGKSVKQKIASSKKIQKINNSQGRLRREKEKRHKSQISRMK